MEYHIDYVSRKVSKSIGVPDKSRHILSKALVKQLYFSFIHSYLNYANVAWASTSKSNLLAVFRHQKHAIRVIYAKDRFTHSQPLFRSANALTVYEINLFQVLCLIYKCKNKSAPSIFHNLYTLKPPNKYTMRNNNLLIEPLKRTKFGQFSISFRGPYLWNKILANKPNIWNIEYYPLFKKKLKETIFSLNNIEIYF